MFGSIDKLIEEYNEQLKNVSTDAQLNDLRIAYVGKNGKVSMLMTELKNVPPENKKDFGMMVNNCKNYIEESFNRLVEQRKESKLNERLKSEKIDISLSINQEELGTKHPLTLVKEEILSTFIGMGFTVSDGPEIELDYYSFQALNIPKDHPARDTQDTFYINENIVLRPHTSPVQVRVMEKQKPPIRIVNPGKVYRCDSDATHSPMFQQIEGLVVDKGITLCDLKGLLEIFAKRLFDESTKVRFRPSHFPFTEPSVEVDVSCAMCHGKGCRLCKGSGWLEILGAGVVNPKVLENVGIDTKEYSGIAFGLGIERTTLVKYGIPDMKLLFENDTRFLKGFTKLY